MGAQIDGLVPCRQFFASLPREVQDAARQQIAREAAHTAAAQRARAFTGAQRIAARTVRLEAVENGSGVRAGGAGLGGELFAGSEFGGRRKRKTYAARSRRGRAYIIHRRRTTMQFLPNVGTRGYWFWPAARQTLTGISLRVRNVIENQVT
jgi:hypothetical protein